MLGAHPRFAILIYIFDRYVCIYKVEDFVVRKIFAEKNLGLDNIFADLLSSPQKSCKSSTEYNIYTNNHNCFQYK